MNDVWLAECLCCYCTDGLPHSVRHITAHPVSSDLLVPDSLDPDDRVPLRACSTCGHVERDRLAAVVLR